METSMPRVRIPPLMARSAIALMILWVVSSGVVAAQSGPTGTWRAVDGTGSWEVDVRVDGTELTGVVSSCASAGRDIRNGRVNGSTVTFSCVAPDRSRSIAFTGTVQGDEISFSWTMQNP